MEDDLYIQILNFVSHEASASIAELKPETSINFDLQVDGDDGEEFILNFSDRFGVDIKHIQIEKHFWPEPSLDPRPFFKYFAHFFEKNKGMLPISVHDLYESAKSKRWSITY